MEEAIAMIQAAESNPQQVWDAARNAVAYWRNAGDSACSQWQLSLAVAMERNLHAVSYEAERLNEWRWRVTRRMDDGSMEMLELETWVAEPDLVVQQAITLGNWNICRDGHGGSK